MFETDLSRLGEIFYPDVGGEENTDLSSFINYAIKSYNARYPSASLRKTKQIRFFGDERTSKMSFTLMPSYDVLILSEFQLYSETDDFQSILKALKGNVVAEFCSLSLDKLTESLRKEIERNRSGDCSHAFNFEIGFSTDPKNQNLIKKAQLEKCEGRLIKNYVPACLEEISLTSDALSFLSCADKLSVQRFFYANSDDNDDLIQETCVLFQQEKGKHVFKYSAECTNNSRLPMSNGSIAGPVIFEFVRKYFGQSSFRKIEFAEPKEAESDD